MAARREKIGKVFGFYNGESYITQFDIIDGTDRARAAYEEYIKEAYRVFSNYLATAQSIREYMDNGYIESEYQQYISGGVNDIPLMHFIKKLRNYILHNNLPIIRPHAYKDKDGFTGRLLVDIAKLGVTNLSWWNIKSKEFMNQFDCIPIDRLTTDHFTIIKDLYSWLTTRYEEQHSREFAELKYLEDQKRKLCEEANIIVTFLYS